MVSTSEDPRTARQHLHSVTDTTGHEQPGAHRHGFGRGHAHDGQPGTMHNPLRYEVLWQLGSAGRRSSIYRTLATVAGIRPGDQVLDVGCGPGPLTRAAAKVTGSSGHVIGVDLSPEMVGYARRRAMIRRGAPTEFRVGDAGALPVPDASVDVVVSALAWHHLPERAQAWAEVLRVLRPGGRLMIAEFRAPGGAAGRAVAGRVFGPAMAQDPTHQLRAEAAAAGATGVRVVRRRPLFLCLLAERPL